MSTDQNVSNGMKYLSDKFNEHPNEHNMTYCEHLRHSWYLSCYSGLASVAFFIHGLFPMTFTETGSEIITDLYNFIGHKTKQE